jgi:hypothetical protein
VKKAGELLSAILDDGILQKARGYHDLFSAWKSIAGESLFAHSRIVELEKSILMVEADHPGWIQILQTRQKDLLDGVCRRFPELTIHGIAFRLSREGGPEQDAIPRTVTALPEEPAAEETGEQGMPPENCTEEEKRTRRQEAFEKIDDAGFKETLLRLESKIASGDTPAAKNRHGSAGKG